MSDENFSYTKEFLSPNQIRSLKGFGLDNEEIENIGELLATDPRCAVCGIQDERLVCDHSHETGKFRGMLCGSCNSGLGMFRDNPRVLIRAALYIKAAQRLHQ